MAVQTALITKALDSIDVNIKADVDINQMVNYLVEMQNQHADNRSYVYNGTNEVVNFSVYNGNDWMLNSFSWFSVAAGSKTMHPNDTVYIELGGTGRAGEGMKLFIDDKKPHHEVKEKSYYIWTGKQFIDITSDVKQNFSSVGQ